jgi:uncharacterized peroxidase-related enzyme
MSRVSYLNRKDLPEFEAAFQFYESYMGFVPSNLYAMGHRRPMVRPFIDLCIAVLGDATVDQPLKQMMAFMSSGVRGCMYCQAHTGSNMARLTGQDDERLAAISHFETDSRFDDRERAALRLARDCAVVPNEVTDAHFDDLRKHFSEEQIVELVATCAVFAFLNLWNETMATKLEDIPIAWASNALQSTGWEMGRHAPRDESN